MELPKKTPVRSYKTDFRKNESPLSEGGLWLNGRKDGIDWCDVLVKDGHAPLAVAYVVASLVVGIAAAAAGIVAARRTRRPAGAAV